MMNELYKKEGKSPSEREMIIDLMDKLENKALLKRVYRLLIYLYLYKDGGEMV